MIHEQLLTGALALLLSTGLVQGDDEAKREALGPSDWVYELYQKHPETLVSDLVLPGTHDSGSYKITADSPPASDAPALYSQFGAPAASWAKTQDLDLGRLLRQD